MLLTNKQVAEMIYQCERTIETGAERLEARKGIQRGVKEISQGVGGLKVIRQALNSSVDIKTFNVNY